MTLFGNVICFSSPCRITHALFHWLTHTPNQFFAAAAALASYFPEVLISCLALRPPLPSSLCPLCPEHSREQPTLPLDWRLYLLQINRNRSMCSKLMKICYLAKNKKQKKKISHPHFVSFRVFCTSNGQFKRPWGSNVLEVKSKHFTLFQSLEQPRISQHTEAFTVKTGSPGDKKHGRICHFNGGVGHEAYPRRSDLELWPPKTQTFWQCAAWNTC